MSPAYILFIVATGVSLLLLMVLKFRLNAFIALLVTSILVGILAGMPAEKILSSIEEGMGGTLGFIAVVVGLGAIFGQMLESSGGARAFAHSLLRKFGKGKASWALMLSGFVIGIPVFLDVGFIILIPIVYALARDAKRSVLFYAIPLLAGLAVTHTMVPPTPGPVAVANILDVDIGWVVLFGILTGIPTAIIAGPVFGRFIAGKIKIDPPATFAEHHDNDGDSQKELPSFISIALIIMTPLLLILTGTFIKLGITNEWIRRSLLTDILVFIGHPFTALIIATFLSMILCIRNKMSGQTILDLSTKALGPAGIIILVTGAGGVLKQILIDSGIGQILAESLSDSSVPLVLLGWSLAALVRITQGSATVAMITAAGIMAPILPVFSLSQPAVAIIVVAIAAGATILSHVNDSGFWIVSKYLGMNEKQTLQSWTVMETIIAVTGLAITMSLSLFIR
ncbi:MAG: gluconate transporter [Bacteroidales bacterium]|nr:gluconate transporter [Bacteroidales bacterium]MBN2632789.1 gluconate transporter [Bacteroidales bacterium]